MKLDLSVFFFLEISFSLIPVLGIVPGTEQVTLPIRMFRCGLNQMGTEFLQKLTKIDIESAQFKPNLGLVHMSIYFHIVPN